MNNLEKLWGLWFKSNTIFTFIVAFLAILFIFVKTSFSIYEGRDILRKLLMVHIEKESIRIGDEIHLKLDTLVVREEITNELLNSYGDVKLSLNQKVVKAATFNIWIHQEQSDYFLTQIYFGDIEVGVLKVEVFWKGFFNTDSLVTPLVFSVFIILSMLIAIYIINFFLRKRVFAPALSEIKKQSAIEGYNQMAKQVSHDIKSPLSAIYVIMKDFDSLPEATRMIARCSIQRIQDIANNLATVDMRNRRLDTESLSAQLLSACIEEIMSEKRIHFKSKMNILIEGDLYSSYGLFAKVNIVEIKRVLSNLINNSVEAFRSNEGVVNIRLIESSSTDVLQIIVEDNGKGIPKTILSKLCTRGVSFGKEHSGSSGSGLGLYHAKSSVESWAGELKIESQEEIGTSVSITLPKTQAPLWFALSLKFGENSTVVILDDDQGIHQIWRKRLTEVGILKKNIHHARNPTEFLNLSNSSHICTKEITYLCDLELIGWAESGLDLIEKLSLGAKAVLVTSHYDDDDIQRRCEAQNIKIIPKMIAAHIPILLLNPKEKFVLLDNDPLVRMAWEMNSKENGIHLHTFDNPDELYQNLDLFSKNTTFYIDSSLGNNQRGQDVALKLFNLGYKNLNMASGHNPDLFSKLHYISGAIGKTPPWC